MTKISMWQKNVWYYDFSFGKFAVAEDGSGITDICLATDSLTGILNTCETPLLRQAKQQLNEYFGGSLARFSLPLSLRGTKFQLSVWSALQNIPYGETQSYKQVAAAVGSPQASRAVGMANHRNPVMIVIPCHRVIGANGSLVGYSGGLSLKEKLLALESVSVVPKDSPAGDEENKITRGTP